MASNGSHLPDLASVLKTLSAYVPAPYSTSKDTESRTEAAPNAFGYQNQTGYKPCNVADGKQGLSNDRSRATPSEPTQKTPSSADIPLPIRQNDCPDPSTITAWPDALKCVMKTVAQNEALQSKIRRLVRTQHDHERQWWDGRKALLAKQEARAEKKRKLDEVLYANSTPHYCPFITWSQLTSDSFRRSVGGTVVVGTDVSVCAPPDRLPIQIGLLLELQ